MIFQKLFRNLKHTLAQTFGFAFLSVGIVLAVKCLILEYNGIISTKSFLGLSSPYFLLGYYLVLLYYFFNVRKRMRYYFFLGIGVLFSLILSILDFFKTCECIRVLEDQANVCQWTLSLTIGMILLKKLE